MTDTILTHAILRATTAHCIARARASLCIHDDREADRLDLAAHDAIGELKAHLRMIGADARVLSEMLG